MKIKQVVLTGEEQLAVANGETVFVKDDNGTVIMVLLGYNDTDGVRQADIDAAEQQAAKKAMREYLSNAGAARVSFQRGSR